MALLKGPCRTLSSIRQSTHFRVTNLAFGRRIPTGEGFVPDVSGGVNHLPRKQEEK